MLLGALCTIARAQVASYDLSSPFTLRGDARDAGYAIDLVPHSHDQVGAAWVSTGFEMGPDDGFVTRFQVEIEPDGFFGTGGFAFVLQGAGTEALGAAEGGLGYEGIAPSLAVELDVYESSGDPDDNHVGIDLDGSVASVATAPVSFPLADYGALYGRIEFADGLLSVFVDPDGDPTGAPALTTPVTLPAGTLWVGFTGSSEGAARRIEEFTFLADGVGSTTGGGDLDDDGPGDDPDDEDPAPADTGSGLVPPDQLPPAFFCGCATTDPRSLAGFALVLLAARRRAGRR